MGTAKPNLSRSFSGHDTGFWNAFSYHGYRLLDKRVLLVITLQLFWFFFPLKTSKSHQDQYVFSALIGSNVKSSWWYEYNEES